LFIELSYLTFQKGWGTLCGYVSKKDKNPYVWGKFPLSEILAEAKAAKSQRKTKTAPGEFSEKKRAERIFKK